MSAPTAGGSGDQLLSSSSAALTKKRTRIVFLNPTEVSNWNDWKSNSEQKHIDETDMMQYEQMLKSQPKKSLRVEVGSANRISETRSKRGRKPRSSKNGNKKRVVDPSQPWLQDTDSDEANVGLEDELDDDEYFRRLEEEKLREDEEEARRKKQRSEARALARARGNITGRNGKFPPVTRTGLPMGRAVSAEVSDSESFSEFGDGAASSFGGSRVDVDEFENPRNLYPHEEEEEGSVQSETVRRKEDRSVLDDFPPSPFDQALDTVGLQSSQGKLTSEFSLSTTDSHTIRMLMMDPIRLRYCSPPLHLPNPSTDLVCPLEYLMDALAIHEVLIRYGYLLRLSPFKIEDFLAALVANENSTLLAEIHMALLRALLREDEATGTWMYSIDCKDSVNLTYYILDRHNWPYLLAAYLNSVKTTEAAARASASSLSALSATATGPGGVAAATDAIPTAALFPEDLIPLDQAYPFVSVSKRVAVLRGIVTLFLGSRPVRGDQLRDGFLTHEDHCRVCQQSGEVLCCDGCTAVFHLGCLNPPLVTAPQNNWLCPVCVAHQVSGVCECLTEEERARKVHRKEPLGSDRAGRSYWYMARRIIVEPTNFTQREPCLPGILDGVYDPHWQQIYADQFLDEPEACEEAEYSVSDFSLDGELEDAPERPLRRIRCNPCVEYVNEPPVYYYSTLNQVMELRSCLSMLWEPWLCQRLDALMPRLHVEMGVTQQLTVNGLDALCRLRPEYESINLAQISATAGFDPTRSHITRVFAIIEAEARRSSLKMSRDGCMSDESKELESLESVLKTSESLDLSVVQPRLPDHLPDDIFNDVPESERREQLGVLIVCDADTCVVRNHDGLFTRCNKALVGGESTHYVSKEDESFACAIRKPDGMSSSHGLRTYRLSDEGSWRSWSNLYTTGVWLGSDQGQAQTEPASSNRSVGHTDKSAIGLEDPEANPAGSTDGDTESGKSPTALVNVIFSRAQVNEDRERKRLLGSKFSFSDTALDLWNYVDPPILASFFTELTELLKFPCIADDSLFRPDWPVTPWQSFDIVRLTIVYMEAQIPLAFFTPAWYSLRKPWIARLMKATTVFQLADSLAVLESSIRPLCFQRTWFSSVGHLGFERSTAAQREEDRRIRHFDRSSSSLNNPASLAQNLIRTKTPTPIRHTVWKSRGEEYRRLGGDGWMWLSATRRPTFEEVKYLNSEYPTLSQLYHRMDPQSRNRGLQHGIGWGVCPDYLKGELPVKRPKASECRGHVLHPITGIPLYLNTQRIPYLIPIETLRATQASQMESSNLRSQDVPRKGGCGDDASSAPTDVLSSNSVISTSNNLPARIPEELLSGVSCDSTCSTANLSSSPVAVYSKPDFDEFESVEHPVVNVSYGLSERVHFPPCALRRQVRKFSSRRLNFRLDELLVRRSAAATADKAAAEAAVTSVKSLEHEINELGQEKAKLEARLADLSEQAQEARTAKAKAVKARRTAGSASDLQPTIRSSSFGVPKSENSMANLVDVEQQSSSVSRRLIQHSFISTSSGNRYRILPQNLCQSPSGSPSSHTRRSVSMKRKRVQSRRFSSEDDSDEQDHVNDDDSDYNQSDNRSRGQKLRRSARRQRAIRRDPDFVTDFDDDDENDDVEDEPSVTTSRDRKFDGSFRSDIEDNEGLAFDHSDLASGLRPRVHFPSVTRTRIIRIPQLDGTKDSPSNSEEDGKENNSVSNVQLFVRDSQTNVGSTDTLGPDTLLQTCVIQPVSRSSKKTQRSGGVINRIVRLVRSVDPQTAGSLHSNGSTFTSTHCGTTPDDVHTVGTNISVDGLRFVVSATGSLVAQPDQDSIPSFADSAVVTNNVSSATGSVVVSLPGGFRLVSVTSTSTAPSPTSSTTGVLGSTQVRVVGSNLIRTAPSTTTTTAMTTSVPAPPSITAPVTVNGSNTVRLVLQPNMICSVNADVAQSSAPGCSTIVTTSLSGESENSGSVSSTRCQPAILRRTLAGGGFKPGELRLFTIPQNHSIASVVATSTARQMASGVTKTQEGNGDGPEFTVRHNANKTTSCGTRLIEDRALPNIQRPLVPHILSKGGQVNLPLNIVLQSNESLFALERAVTEATTRLTKIDTEIGEVKQQMSAIDQKLKELNTKLSTAYDLQRLANQPPSAPYSLLKKRLIDPYNNSVQSEKTIQNELAEIDCTTVTDRDRCVLLPAKLPPVNTYVWPPFDWPEEKKKGFSSVSSLFRWHPKNLRGLILAAGRRELQGYDAEKKRLVQVFWPYPTAKPSFVETWRFRLSQLRFSSISPKKKSASQAFDIAEQGLAHLALLLRSLWHVIRWDEMLSEPSDADHILDNDGHPCLREVIDYADSGTGKSGEPSFCTRRIIGVQPLDRFWLRVNYLVQLTHSRPDRDRARKSRGPASRPGRHSSTTESRKRLGRKSGRQRSRNAGGNDPDYNPIEDEPWRANLRRGRRRRTCGSDEGNGEVNLSEDSDADESSADTVDVTDSSVNRVSHVEEVWMSEENLHMWEIRLFMNAYLPPKVYSDFLINSGDGISATSGNILKARWKPARLPLSSNKCQSVDVENELSTENNQVEIDISNEPVANSTTTTPLLTFLDAHSSTRRTPLDSVHLAQSTVHRPTLTSTRRSRPAPEVSPPIPNEILEAKARARSIAAARAARASVAARKAKAEKLIVEQRAKAIRTQTVTRRRLYLNLARALAEEAVEERKTSLFANNESDSVDDDDSGSVHTSPLLSQMSLKDTVTRPTALQPLRRPRGRPPYGRCRGLRRPLATSQMQYSASTADQPKTLGNIGKTPLHSVDDARDNEEQENKPEWTLNRNSFICRPRSVRRGSTFGRRGRPRSRGLSRPNTVKPRIPHALLTEPSPDSPTQDNLSEASSSASTASTCPGLGDTKVEAILAIPEEPVNNMCISRGAGNPKHSLHPVQTGRGSRGTRRRVGRPPGRGTRGTTRTPLVDRGDALRSSGSLLVPNKKVENQNNRPSGVYCLCRMPYDPSREYLGCDLCQDWFHFECVGLTPADASRLGDSWHCPDCRLAEEHANEMLYCLCRTPYEPTRVYIACDRCDEWYHAECVGLTPQQAATHAGTYLCPRCPNVKPHALALQEKELKKQHLEEEQLDGTARTLYETPISPSLRSQLTTLLRDLQEHKMAWPFLQILDASKYPAFQSLEDPKTLTNISERLAGNQYKTLGDFSFAMNSLFFDARVLFLKGTPEFHCTEVMEALFIRKMKELKTRSDSPY